MSCNVQKERESEKRKKEGRRRGMFMTKFVKWVFNSHQCKMCSDYKLLFFGFIVSCTYSTWCLNSSVPLSYWPLNKVSIHQFSSWGLDSILMLIILGNTLSSCSFLALLSHPSCKTQSWMKPVMCFRPFTHPLKQINNGLQDRCVLF